MREFFWKQKTHDSNSWLLLSQRSPNESATSRNWTQIRPKPADSLHASTSMCQRQSGSPASRGSHKMRPHVLLDGRRRVGNSWVGRIAASWEKNCTFRGLSNPHGGIASAPVQKVSRSARLISVPSSEKQTCSYGTTENITTGKFYSPCTTCCKFTLDCSVSNGKLSQILSNFSHNFLQWKLHKTG